MKKKSIVTITIVLSILVVSFIAVELLNPNYETIETSSTNLSNQKICWGIKRA